MCKYCKGSHGSADHAHSNSMKDSDNKAAKGVADKKYAAEAHNRKAAKSQALKKKASTHYMGRPKSELDKEQGTGAYKGRYD